MYLTWIENANAIVALISGLIGLVAAGIPAIVAVVKLIKSMAKNTAADNWAIVTKIADAAITEAEKSGKSGADKKQMVIDVVKASCKSQGIDADAFLEALSVYIDDCVTFANNLKK